MGDDKTDEQGKGDSNAPESWSNRRSDERAAITLRVDYKRLNTFFADYAKNISKGGTFIRTDRPLDVGTEFVFVLSLPNQNENLQLRGRVMWAVPPEKETAEQQAGMGIKFIFASEEERLVVDSFVERLMKQSLGAHISSRMLKTGEPGEKPGKP